MKRSLLVLFLVSSLVVTAQTRPTGACPFAGFDGSTQSNPQVAEVATKTAATAWMACDSPKGCISLRFDPDSPVLIYMAEGPWTCGYSEDRHGAAPAWFRSSELRPVKYEQNPPVAAWQGTWTGDEDRVVIAPTTDGKALHLIGTATWHGAAGVEHYGSTEGNAIPKGNHLHLAEGGQSSCTIDLTLIGKFIVASDNDLCGGMNVRFQGFWKRTSPHHPTPGNPH